MANISILNNIQVILFIYIFGKQFEQLASQQKIIDETRSQKNSNFELPYQ